ncbi:MAG: sulfatase-like hydrolase/transferase [Rikenellaceae bacterium]
MNRNFFVAPLSVVAVSTSFTACNQAPQEAKQPNVIVILADDMGVGDISAYGAKRISTPNIDRLANEGLRFNNGYASSATSTPSRYALLTGVYPWKNPNAKILSGDAPLLIPTDQYTLPKMMQSQGYTTAAIGKWHLGMGDGNVDWNTQITPSANAVGFDYTNLIAATNDRVPTVFVRNGCVVGLEADDQIYVNYKENFEGEPTALTNPEMLKMTWHHGHNQSIMNGIPRIGYQKGGKNAHWVDEDMADYFSGEVKAFLAENKEKPFFLYYGLHEPHVPRAPHSRFVGSTDLGPRGDAVVEADWCVGELIANLEREGLLENTIIIYSSDNGPVLNDGYNDGAAELLGDHNVLDGRRGGKYSLLEGGTRVPLMVYWKGRITPAVSDALICQMDIMPSLAKMLDVETPAIDGEEYLDVFLGKSEKGRTTLVHEAGARLAYRKNQWVVIPAYDGEAINIPGNETGYNSEIMLWNVEKDPGQQVDLAAKYPEKVNELWVEFMEVTKGYYNPDAPTIHFE